MTHPHTLHYHTGWQPSLKPWPVSTHTHKHTHTHMHMYTHAEGHALICHGHGNSTSHGNLFLSLTLAGNDLQFHARWVRYTIYKVCLAAPMISALLYTWTNKPQWSQQWPHTLAEATRVTSRADPGSNYYCLWQYNVVLATCHSVS